MMLLVNETSHFQMHCMQKCCHFLWKMWARALPIARDRREYFVIIRENFC